MLDRGLTSTRTLFAAPGAGYNPLTVDEEVVLALKQMEGSAVKGRLRLVGFLPPGTKASLKAWDFRNPNDQLYFKAGNRAVSIADYSLKLLEASLSEPNC